MTSRPTVPFRVSGTTLRLVAGLKIAEAEYARGFRMPMHAHDPAYLGVVARGSYEERSGSTTRGRRSGGVIYHAPGERHAVDFDGATIVRIELDDRWLARAREASVAVEDSADLPTAARPLAARVVRELRRRDGASDLALESLVLELLVAFARQRPVVERGRPRWMDDVIELLHAERAQALTLGEIAAAVRVHPTHLARTFRRCAGTTIGGFLRDLRIERARRQIVETNLPLAQIAQDNGFADQSHLCRWISRATGLSPRALRNARER